MEPEKRKLGQDTALVGNRRGKDDVERGETVRGDDQKLVAEGVDIADLAAGGWREGGELRLFQGPHGRGRGQGKNSPPQRKSNLSEPQRKAKKGARENFAK